MRNAQNAEHKLRQNICDCSRAYACEPRLKVNGRSSGTHLINRERVRCQRFGAAARREEGEYPPWICDRRATPSQWQRSATLRAKLWRAPGVVAPQSQSASAMLLRRALPVARQSLAHSFPIYERSSKSSLIAVEFLSSDSTGSMLASLGLTRHSLSL